MRHPSVANLFNWLTPNKNLPDTQQRIAQGVHDLAAEVEPLCTGPELSEGLRKLLEAKDCLVRASLDKERADARGPVEREPIGKVGPGEEYPTLERGQ